MENTSSFIFIPDISGFSDFVNETEINHSQHIISELLEIIIRSDSLGLKVSEIEGDAILFYSKEIPAVEDILLQAQEMFINFHHHLRKYETLRICQCGACKTASKLSLKFIAHAGSFSFINVQGFHKPFGKAVVTAHKLLKNSIPNSEYLLLTDDLISLNEEPVNIVTQAKFEDVEELSTGLNYKYINLNYLNDLIPPVEHFDLPQKTKNPVRLRIIINRPMEEIHSWLIDLEFKKKWNQNIDEIQYESDRINRVGYTHTCIINSMELKFQTLANRFGNEKWIYGEKLLNPALVREADFYYILEKIDSYTSQLSFELHYIPFRGPLKLLSLLFRARLRFLYRESFSMLKTLLEKENNPRQIVHEKV
ncbi:MAG: DUF2652 domain-containing protein [Cyclobacteriaceae bacterium]|nr:DUF2652 domain-containing protein [Cyclobacteriaceae bacterium]